MDKPGFCLCAETPIFCVRGDSILDIRGFLPLTLLDFPGRTACTVFTGGCNFRCPFCHNTACVLSPRDKLIPQGSVLSFLDKRRGLLDGVCVSGGEPLLQPDLERFLKRIKARGFLVKLDTNGSFPDTLRRLLCARLVDYVAMDIKNSPGGYAQACGVDDPGLSAVQESIALLLSDTVDYEFRTTVVKGLHTARSLRAAAESIAGARRYFLQPCTDSGSLLHGEGLSAYSPGEMQEFLELVGPYVQHAALRGV
jgi:pyruvate formate lyase activating enzyme